MSSSEINRRLAGKKECFTNAYIDEQVARHKGISKELYERAVASLEYLAELRDCGLEGIEIEFIDIEQNQYRDEFMFREPYDIMRLIEQLKVEGILEDERDEDDRNYR